MVKLSLLCADIPLTITINKGEFNPAYVQHFIQQPPFKAKAIEITAEIEPRLNTVDSEVDKPPVVTLRSGIFNIAHQLYTGTYDTNQEMGAVSVHNSFSLVAFIRLLVSVVLADRGGLAIHSSCIYRNNKVHIFSGPSGNGKSTVIKLTANPLLYSDEVTLVRKDAKGVFRVHHSPFRSEFHTKPLPPADKIAGIYFLEQDAGVYLEPLSQPESLIKLLPNIFFPVKERNPYEKKIFQLCCDFSCQVKAAVMHFRKDNLFWRCIGDDFSTLETEPGYNYQNH